MSGFGGFHGSEQTSLPWLTWLLSACWKSQSLHLAGLTTHSSPQPRAETLQLSTQIVSTRSPAGACLACCSSKSPSQHQGRSLALGLLVCLLAWASFEHLLFLPKPPPRAESRGHRQPARRGVCKRALEPGNPPSQALCQSSCQPPKQTGEVITCLTHPNSGNLRVLRQCTPVLTARNFPLCYI